MLRYLTLKAHRDGSLWAFFMLPALFPFGALLGPAVASRQFRYPFYMNAGMTPIANATLCAGITGAGVVVFASIVAFWMLRPEVASHAIGSFLFGTRSLTIVSSVVVFGATIGITSWITAVLIIKLLTTAWPAHVLMLFLQIAAVTILLSSAGILLLMISVQPAMIIGAYVFALCFLPLEKRPATQIIAAVITTIACMAISTFLLERRCAT